MNDEITVSRTELEEALCHLRRLSHILDDEYSSSDPELERLIEAIARVVK